MLQVNIYYVILIATSVNSQISLITSVNATQEEVSLALGPASVSLKLSGTKNSEEISATELSNSLSDSKEIRTEILENVTTINENPVSVEVEAIATGMLAVSGSTDTSNSTMVSSIITESGSSMTISTFTESANTPMESNLSNIGEAPNSTSPILTDSSLITISTGASTNISLQSSTVPSNSTMDSSIITESTSSMTRLFSSTGSTNTPRESNLSNIGAAASSTSSILVDSSITVSRPTSINISSQSTNTVLPMLITTMMDITGATEPSISSIITESYSPMTTSSSKTTEATSTRKEPNLTNTEATPTSISILVGSTSITTSLPTSKISIQSTTTVIPMSTKISTTKTLSPNLCGENEVYSCLPLCPRTCNNPLSKMLCLPIPYTVSFCRRGCTCITGYLLEKTIGKCVKTCPSTVPLRRLRGNF